ncbi:serine hydrolase domain-containing protein [Niameybacter massiliensis]|uniref:serine hydrolase domain-containing protein n=1 Tax=Niameybacter massiliensis TaxID=1658108 RepID=UPI0006B65508|nr:serine hydrolase domain-containing protein [Niameybacter massiliensis]
MKKKWLLSLAVLLAAQVMPVQPIQAQEVVAIKQENTNTLEQIAQAKAKIQTTMLGTTSLQYALIDNGDIVLSGVEGVYSKTETGTLDQNTMYGIGSTSKMFTTAAVMKLVEEGKVDLDKSVTTYIPEFKMKDERYKEITVRMLLNHSSGLMGSTFNNAFLLDDFDTEAHDNLLKQLSTQRLKANPGEYSTYCNDGFTLAEIIVERVSNMDFTSFLHTYITTPMELDNTKTSQDEVNDEQFARTYTATTGGLTPRDCANVIGTGGIYSTAEDLCKFSNLFMRDSEKSLLDVSLDAMEVNEAEKGIWAEAENTGLAFGLGWDNVNTYPFNEYGIKALVKGGDTLLYHASLIVLPEYNMAAAVVSSGGASTYNQFLATDILLEQLKAKGIIDEIKPTPTVEVPEQVEMPQELIQQNNIYINSMGVYGVEITSEGVLNLICYNMTVPVQSFVYTTDGDFVSKETGVRVSVVTEENGKDYLYVEGIQTIPGLGSIPVSEYQLEKVEAISVDQKIEDAWKNRVGKPYYLLNEKYSSQVYLNAPVGMLTMTNELPGYVSNNKIISENEAQAVVQLPSGGGRDLGDISMYEKEGIEYMNLQGGIYMPIDAIKDLANAKEAICTIGEEGYTRWFKIPSTLAGKTIVVEVPEESAIMVYDKNGLNVENTYLTKSNNVVLPEGGMIGFVGEAGAQFSYKLK